MDIGQWSSKGTRDFLISAVRSVRFFVKIRV